MSIVKYFGGLMVCTLFWGVTIDHINMYFFSAIVGLFIIIISNAMIFLEKKDIFKGD